MKNATFKVVAAVSMLSMLTACPGPNHSSKNPAPAAAKPAAQPAKAEPGKDSSQPVQGQTGEQTTAPEASIIANENAARNDIDSLQMYLDSLEMQLNEIKASQGKLTAGAVVTSVGSFALATAFGVNSTIEFNRSVEAEMAKANAATKALIQERIAAIQQINSTWVYDRAADPNGKFASVKSKFALPPDTKFSEITRVIPDGKGGFLIEMLKQVPVENFRKIAVIRLQQPLNAANTAAEVVVVEGNAQHSSAKQLGADADKIRAEAERIRQTTRVEPIKVSRLNKSAAGAIGFGLVGAIVAGVGVANNMDLVLSNGNEKQLKDLISQARAKLAKLQDTVNSSQDN